MITCPKCGSGRISGPRYGKDGIGRERLYYKCSKCGYVQAEPTYYQEQVQPLGQPDAKATVPAKPI